MSWVTYDWMKHEFRLICRSRLCVTALVLLGLLSAIAVVSGLREVARQRDSLARLAPLQAQDLAAVAAKQARGGDAGYAAYYSFHETVDPPTDAAFFALGLRDVAPQVLRVRALGLQAQLYEGETFNPELALTGRFDFAFVLIYLAPLFIIALLHDLVSGERQSGRLTMLQALPGPPARLWQRRAGLRLALVLAALGLPLALGLTLAGTGAGAVLDALSVVLVYVVFWGGLSLLIAACRWTSTTQATALMGAWLLLTLVLPTLANLAITRGVPVSQGVELMLKQRQNVHGAWDLPRDATMQRFFLGHPEWRDTAPLPLQFHWKWYYAFQQLGDESVVAEVQAYRAGLQARQQWTERLGGLLPGVGAQALLHAVADTDLPAQLAYQRRIEAFHRDIREFYYPYLFNERPFGPADQARLPQYVAPDRPVRLDWPLLLPLAGWALCALGGGLWGLQRGICRRL